MFTVTDTKKFKTAIALAAKAAEKKQTMPILTYGHFFSNVQGAFFRATDLETVCTVEISACIEYAAPFSFLSPIKPLIDATRKQKNAYCIGEVEKNRLSIATMKIETLPIDEFPVYPAIDAIPLSCANLADALKKVSYAAGESDTRYVLNGILFDIENKKIVGTDGHRLALTDLDISGMPIPIPDAIKHVIIPRKSIGIMETIAGNPMAAFTKDRAAFYYHQLTGSAINAEILIRPIEGKFPNYTQVLPASHDTGITVNREGLINAIGQVCGVMDKRRRTIAVYARLGEIVVYASNPDIGSARASVPGMFSGDPATPELVINSEYLLDTLQSMAGDLVSIAYNGINIYRDKLSTPTSPVTITDQLETAVIMPLRGDDPGKNIAAEDRLYIEFPEDVKTAMLDACRSKRIARKLAESKARVISWADYAEQLVYSGAFRKALKIYKRIGALVQYRELLECLPDFERMTAKQPRMVQA